MRSLRVHRVIALLFAVSCGGAPPSPPPPRAAQRASPAAPRPSLPWERERAAVAEVRSPLIALRGATILTAAGPAIPDGVLVMQNGRIVAVGPASQVRVPDGAEVIDVSGKFITPGIIDVHSHMGVASVPSFTGTSDANETTSALTPELRAADAFWPQDPALSRARAAGVTTIQSLPGSANLIGGAGVILKLHPARSVSEMIFPGAPETLKMACGENPKRTYAARNQPPATRMGSARALRQAFQQALEYRTSWRNWQEQQAGWQRRRRAFERARDAGVPDGGSRPDDPGPPPAPPARDFGRERLLGAIEGRVSIHMHCYRADEMALMIEMGRELGFHVRAFHHAVEAYKIRDLLAQENIAIATWADWWGFKLEAYDAIEQNLALLTEAGVRGVLHSDSNMLVQRLNQEAAKAMTSGRRVGIEISEEQALRWITINAAWTLGIDDQVGSLEAGKMADVVVWSGNPFSVYARAERVYIDGVLEHDASAPSRPSDFELGQDIELEGAP